MPLILIAGTIGFASREVRDAAVAAAAPLQQSTRDDEPGCLAYSFAADSGNDTQVQVFESWTDADALDAHFAHPNFWAMKELLRGFERSGPSSIVKYSVDRTGTVYRPDGTPTAAFD